MKINQVFFILSIIVTCYAGNIGKIQLHKECDIDFDCVCNATAPYQSCSQSCEPVNCFENVNMTCVAKENCTQNCETGLCFMTCHANKYCEQNAIENGAKEMKCSSATRLCKQYSKGDSKKMLCEADECDQNCDSGSCTMNCTDSVSFCSQKCTTKTRCVLDCQAKNCIQECSGSGNCIIVNRNKTKNSSEESSGSGNRTIVNPGQTKNCTHECSGSGNCTIVDLSQAKNCTHECSGSGNCTIVNPGQTKNGTHECSGSGNCNIVDLGPENLASINSHELCLAISVISFVLCLVAL